MNWLACKAWSLGMNNSILKSYLIDDIGDRSRADMYQQWLEYKRLAESGLLDRTSLYESLLATTEALEANLARVDGTLIEDYVKRVLKRGDTSFVCGKEQEPYMQKLSRFVFEREPNLQNAEVLCGLHRGVKVAEYLFEVEDSFNRIRNINIGTDNIASVTKADVFRNEFRMFRDRLVISTAKLIIGEVDGVSEEIR